VIEDGKARLAAKNQTTINNQKILTARYLFYFHVTPKHSLMENKATFGWFLFPRGVSTHKAVKISA
jgi:hypothetical protein